MDLLIFLFTPVLLFIAGKQVLTAFHSKSYKGLVKASATLLVPLAIFFGDEIVGHSILYYKCENDGGYSYDSVIRTDSYYKTEESGDPCDASCRDALLHHGFKFYETNARKGYNQSYGPNDRVIKFFLAPEGADICLNEAVIDRHAAFSKQGKCLAMTKLPEPQSRYEVSMYQRDSDDQSPYKITKIYSSVKDRASGQILAEATSYSFKGGWVKHNSFGYAKGTICPSLDDSHFRIFREVFLSNAG